LKKQLEEMHGAIDGLVEMVRIISLGIDYRRYSRFKILTPRVFFDGTGEPFYSRTNIGTRMVHSKETAEFCVDFVIETALSLLRFDYSLKVDPGGMAQVLSR
jgi:hypothetical protein